MVGQDRQTYVYYTCLVIKKSVLMFICNVLVQHIQHIRPKWAPEAYRLASLSEPVLMMHYLFLGTTMIACVDIGMDIFSHVVATVFKTGVVPAMDAPWCSASVGEFWGKRWNYVIQLNLKRCGYTPFLNMFAPSVPQSKGLKGGGNGHSQGTVHKGYIILATLYTFLLSAAIHEWIIYISCDAQHTGEQALFFVAHGVICIMEGLAGNLFPAVRVPKILRIAYCFVVMGCTAPLFFNPMIRDGSYYRYTIWIA